MIGDPLQRRSSRPGHGVVWPESGEPLLKPDGPRTIALWNGLAIGSGAFLAAAKDFGRRLPDGAFVLNLCEDRYRFSLALVAALLWGRITLLPPDRSPWTLRCLKERFRQVVCVADRRQDDLADLDILPVDPSPFQDQGEGEAIAIAPEQTAAIVFTSGSTGQPQAHPKTWGSLVESARLIAEALGSLQGRTLVATVPPQHMYGLELSVLPALRCGAVLDARRPFFPLDVQEALESVAGPRILVTTPVHLRALTAAGITLPALDLIVSATAPLPRTLAEEAERRFRAPLWEIYGCTEAGSIASRRTAREESWQVFTGMRLLPAGDGHCVEAAHLPEPIPLNDIVELLPDGRFRLLGRRADLVNIAGKRTSLGALNHILTSLEGVLDGAFFLPDETPGCTARLVAFVVAPGVEMPALLEALRQRLDPVFLPRALYPVAALPRSESGKLPRQALQALAERLGATRGEPSVRDDR